VLNAFRHHGVSRTPASHKRSNRRPCAQRLSASRSFAVHRRHHVKLRITVLNAFRHHGVSREEELRTNSHKLAVLNAFRHHGVSRAVHISGRPGVLPVLNAFRHHGVSRASKDRRGQPVSPVLNAFRHHGVSRLVVLVIRRGLHLLCSTPFGITEFRGRRRVGRAGRAGRVLNAFRHHGVSRLPNAM